MRTFGKHLLPALAAILILTALPTLVAAEDGWMVLTGADLARIVPLSFHFKGRTATTQTRNSAGARYGTKRSVVAGMVDTSGYSADIRAKYEGFLITDSAIAINGSRLGAGSYGFGFTNDGKLNIFDLNAQEVLSVSTTKDTELKRPRPLMMTSSEDKLRFYSGREYAVIEAK